MRRGGPLRRRAALVRHATKRRKPTRGGFDRQTVARIKDRDGGCVSCGKVHDPRLLVAHHRRNRGAGGSSDPDTNSVRNGLALCWPCNGAAESDAAVIIAARFTGVKLRQGQPLSTPVRYPDGSWWVLLEDGTRRPAREEEAA